MADPNPPIESHRHAPPDVRRHLFKTPVEKELKKSIVVIDRSGGWMLNWQKAYRALDISHLRSPEGLHADPYDHSALPVYAKHMKLENEYVPMTQLGRGKTMMHNKGHAARDQEGFWYHGPFRLPTIDLFSKFSKHLIDKSYGPSNFASLIPALRMHFTRAGIEWCRCHHGVCMARPYEEHHHSGRACA